MGVGVDHVGDYYSAPYFLPLCLLSLVSKDLSFLSLLSLRLTWRRRFSAWVKSGTRVSKSEKAYCMCCGVV